MDATTEVIARAEKLWEDFESQENPRYDMELQEIMALELKAIRRILAEHLPKRG